MFLPLFDKYTSRLIIMAKLIFHPLALTNSFDLLNIVIESVPEA